MLWKLYNLIQEVDRKISRGRKRGEMDRDAMEMLEDEKLRRRDRRVRELDEKMEDLLEQMEDLGDQGKVDEAQDLLRRVEQFQKEKDAIKAGEVGSFSFGDRVRDGQEFRVCEICGVFSPINARPQETLSHLEGKQH